MFLRHQVCLVNIRRSLSKLSYIHKAGNDLLQPLTIGKLLEQTARKHPNRVAIISCHQKKQLTFAELLKNADNFAAGLRKLKINHGDHVGIWAPNSIEWVVTLMACARIGATLVQINPVYKDKELKYSVNKTRVKALVCGPDTDKVNHSKTLQLIDSNIFVDDNRETISTAMPSLKNIITINENSGTYFQTLMEGHSGSELKSIGDYQDDVQIDDAANIQFTSGSTGPPKAAVLTHHGIVNNARLMGIRLELHKKHHITCVQLPLFHTYGSTVGLLAGIHSGATMVLPSYFYNPKSTLQACYDHKCTVIYGTPTMHLDFVNEQKKQNLETNLELAVTGGGPVTPQLIYELHKIGFSSIVSGYGMTETTALTFQTKVNDPPEIVAHTLGKVSDHTEVKVIGEDGRMVQFGQPGELCVRGYQVMREYLDDPKKTQEVLTSDRWLKTGDKVILSEDGTARIVGRLKEIIIRGGENIHPKEIEDHLVTHPKIKDAQIVGVPHQRLGEEVCACLIPKAGCQITLEEVVAHCGPHMADFKIPSRLHVMEEYPKTTSGKIQKFKIVETLKEIYNL